MADFKDILHQFPEETLQNTIQGKILGGKVNWKKKPIWLKVEEVETKEILFRLDDIPVRIRFTENNGLIDDINKDALVNHLFWLTDMVDNRVVLKHLPSGNFQSFDNSLEIGFGDNFIVRRKGTPIEKISKDFKRDFVYKSANSDFIFVETYLNNTEQSFTIHGNYKRADIIVRDSKWIIKKIRNKPFTKKHNDFLDLKVVRYPSIDFVEESKAKEAYDTIKEEAAKGRTLISLWETYSAIEFKRAEQLKDQVGELSFVRKRFFQNGITRIQIKEINEDSKTVFKEHRDELLNTSFQLIGKSNGINNLNNENYKIKSINDNLTVDIYDDLYSLPEQGLLTISIIGDEVVKKRRERALKSLRENRRFINRNLLFAIEGVADAMINKSRKEKALTDRTKKFIKEKFGIDKLTQNQRDAVEIAVNTPDIAIVQGPPGTGKTTVVAAICDRLIEIAEKKSNKRFYDKLILVSAFQNDTVEHIASKIHTHGLPTIKIGKVTKGNIKVENKLIEEIRLKIDKSLQRLSLSDKSYRISKILKDIQAIYKIEQDDKWLKQEIEEKVSTNLSDELWERWQEINSDKKFNEQSSDKNIKLLKGIRTSMESYNDDGYSKVRKLLKSDIPLTEKEKSFLEDCPIDNPEKLILQKLSKIQETYLEKINESINTISSGSNVEILDFLEEAINYFKLEEEASYGDEDTFLVANLEAIRSELDGNTEYIREAIKNYGESLAATNQVAGGREMSQFSNIENVVLEEAARSNPLDLLIPMAKATERIIMVGDQKQLPHLLENEIAEETWTEISNKYKNDDKNDNKYNSKSDTRKKLEEALFGVIFRNLQIAKPIRTITLTEQFRMHPFIGDFISKVYYDNQVKSGIPNQEELKRHNLELPWLKNKVAIFCNVEKNKGLEESGKSKSRKAEAKRIVKLLDELKLDPNFEDLSIGIITFYSKQVNVIFEEATKKGYTDLKKDGTHEIAPEYRETSDNREKLRIGSVDSFQGKEFDIVILSTVRSNKIKRNDNNYKKVFGFLTLENRLNVAFSRAKKLIIVVGDGEMFLDDFAETYVKGLHEFYTNLSIDKNYGNRI